MAEHKAPQQQIFDAIFQLSLDLGYKTTDELPPESFGYPFVMIGEQFDSDRRTKDYLYGDVQQTIHVYHTHKKRNELSSMMMDLKRELRRLKSTNNFYLKLNDLQSRTIKDISTGETLNHAIIEVSYTFY